MYRLGQPGIRFTTSSLAGGPPVGSDGAVCYKLIGDVGDMHALHTRHYKKYIFPEKVCFFDRKMITKKRSTCKYRAYGLNTGMAPQAPNQHKPAGAAKKDARIAAVDCVPLNTFFCPKLCSPFNVCPPPVLLLSNLRGRCQSVASVGLYACVVPAWNGQH